MGEEQDPVPAHRQLSVGAKPHQPQVFHGRTHLQRLREQLAEGAKFRSGQPILKKRGYKGIVCGFLPSGLFRLDSIRFAVTYL